MKSFQDKISPFVILILFLFLFLSCSSTRKESFAFYSELGKASLEIVKGYYVGNYLHTVLQYELMKTDTSHQFEISKVYQEVGLSYERLGLDSCAIIFYTELLDDEGVDVEYVSEKVLTLYYEQGQYDKVTEFLERNKSVVLNSKAKVVVAKTYNQVGRYDESVKYINLVDYSDTTVVAAKALILFSKILSNVQAAETLGYKNFTKYDLLDSIKCTNHRIVDEVNLLKAWYYYKQNDYRSACEYNEKVLRVHREQFIHKRVLDKWVLCETYLLQTLLFLNDKKYYEEPGWRENREKTPTLNYYCAIDGFHKCEDLFESLSIDTLSYKNLINEVEWLVDGVKLKKEIDKSNDAKIEMLNNSLQYYKNTLETTRIIEREENIMKYYLVLKGDERFSKNRYYSKIGRYNPMSGRKYKEAPTYRAHYELDCSCGNPWKEVRTPIKTLKELEFE